MIRRRLDCNDTSIHRWRKRYLLVFGRVQPRKPFGRSRVGLKEDGSGMLHRREFLLGSAAIAVMGGAGSASLAKPTSASIRDVLKRAVGGNQKVAGMIAVVVDRGGTRMASYGSSGVPNLAMDADTVFEIMSITKVLTSLLLADMVVRGEVALGDPVAKYLPLTLHDRGRPITLLDLATYTSGLPNMPGNVPPDWYADPNPMRDYTEARLFEFLASHVPKYEPGTHYEYANLGFGLLGIALARRAGKSYEELLIERVCDPLGLADTRITLTGKMRRHLVQGHDLNLKPTPLWDVPAMPGMGCVRSNAKDLTLLLRASMGLARSPLREPLTRLVDTRKSTSLAGTEAGLGWFISSDNGEQVVWKSGLSGGCNTFIGFSPQTHRGALVLSNFLWQPIDAGTISTGIKMIKPDFHPVDFNALYAHG
jgi:D-alanyl-D-alanine-carboxypeptidase/D-alanyl-D-alanine-endopeptidase